MTTRTLVLGDWNAVIRDPLALLRGAFLLGAIVFAALGESGAANLVVAAAAVVATRFLNLSRPFDLAFILAMGLTGWGEALRLYDRFAWEILEWTSDETLGSRLSLGQDDTIGDLAADSVGALLGAALLVLWTVYGWGSVRRIPGENRFEERNA